MVSFNVIVESATGSSKQEGELFLASGIIQYKADGEGKVYFSGIDSEVAKGKKVYAFEKVKEETKTPVEKAPEAPSEARSEAPKKKQKKA